MTNRTIYGREIGDLRTGTGNYVGISLDVESEGGLYLATFDEARKVRDGEMTTPTKAFRVARINESEGEFSTVETEDNEILEAIATEIKREHSPRIE